MPKVVPASPGVNCKLQKMAALDAFVESITE